jgi:hypothetical protein
MDLPKACDDAFVRAALVLLLPLALLSVAAGAPKPPGKRELAQYRAALKLGRTLEKKGDHAAAIAAFQKALAVVPGDARALSELGWAQLQAGSLAAASAATQQAIAGASEPALKAASLYNLGRIFEAQAARDRALDAYRRSLELRENGTVRQRLLGLDPAAAPPGALEAVPLEGPFASIAEYCKKLEAKDADEPCDAGDNPFAETRLPAAAPWMEVRVFVGGYEELCNLAIRTHAGWWVAEGFAECKLMGGRWDRNVSPEGGELRDVVPGGAPELLLRWATEETFNVSDPDGEAMTIHGVTSRKLLVCGIGPSKAPSCLGPVVTARDESTISEPATRRDPPPRSWKLEARLDAGVLTLAATGGASSLSAEESKLLGAHPLAFP